MKRVYKQSYLTRTPRALISRTLRFLARNRGVLITGFACLLLLLFIASIVAVTSEARVQPGIVERTRTIQGAAGPAVPPPYLYANAAVLIDRESGRVLFEKNANTRLPVASTTKMLTAIVVRKNLDNDEMVTVSREASEVGEREMWLEPGETLTVKDLLWAMLVQSANDASYALAEHTAGSIDSFARMMNEEAEKIGAKNSHFSNPHGLDSPGHYSSAYDLALIARELLKDPLLAKMVASRTHDIPWPGHTFPRTAVNHNELLGKYEGADGVKTGYTVPAGQCLVGSAIRGETGLIAVSLNSTQRAGDVVRLLDYGFSSTVRAVLVKKGERLGRVRVSAYPRRYVDVIAGGDLAILSLKGFNDVFTRKAILPKVVKGPVKKGSPVGVTECLLNGKKVQQRRGRAARSVSGAGLIPGIAAFVWYVLCMMGRMLSAPFRIF